jgi:hypothetical protein
MLIDFIDPAQKICIVLPHPCDKNKNVAGMGHPNSDAIHKGLVNKTDYGLSVSGSFGMLKTSSLDRYWQTPFSEVIFDLYPLRR